MRNVGHTVRACRVPPRAARGLALAEVAVSAAIISIMLVAVLQTVAAARQNQTVVERRLTARRLAQTLLSEILSKPFSDPDQTPTFGREAGEAAARTAFDDVDDYTDWVESPPQDVNGSSLSGYAAWSRSVKVIYADVTGNAVSGDGQACKQITVSVKYNSAVVFTARAVRAATP